MGCTAFRVAGLTVLTLLVAPGLRAEPVPSAPQTVSGMVEELTRGIRLPADAPSEAQTPETPLAGSQPLATAAATTAPPGRPAVSITLTFASGSAALTPEAQRELAVLGQALATPDLSGYRFRVEGHTDTVGAAAANRALSERRAASVRAFLERSYGVPVGRLEAVGLGETQPLVPTPDEQAEPRNRRVQVVNLGR
ncbi:OmpA family protein [Muricoccus radiodurans]|uniref:OmpA family protein n=1 Tax=Muricoccus radiodurans TaxID=2231721 RepID=UPI003CF59993